MTAGPDTEAAAGPDTEAAAGPDTEAAAGPDTEAAAGTGAPAGRTDTIASGGGPHGAADTGPAAGTRAAAAVGTDTGPAAGTRAAAVGRHSAAAAGTRAAAAVATDHGTSGVRRASAARAPGPEPATIAAAAAVTATATAARRTTPVPAPNASAAGRPPPAEAPAAPPAPAAERVPPWRTVLWTTLRLWSGRAFRRRGRLRGWLAAMVAVVAVLGVAVVVQIALSRRPPAALTGGLGTGQRSAGQSAPGLGGAAVRGLAATWIAHAVSGSAIVACDPAMCSALQAAGMLPTSLLVLRPSAGDPLGADLIAATPTLRSQFQARLTSVYAPVTVAKFGTGPAHIDVRVIAPYGSAAYQAALSADLAARRTAGGQLLANSKIGVDPAARAPLTAGLVDSRVLLMLPALVATHPVRVLAFAGRAPGADAAMPYVAVKLATAGTGAGMSPARYRSWLQGFLSGQQVPFRPAQVTVSGGAAPTVLIRFGLPSPVGLLGRG